jgi:hypothetical protein
VFIFAEVLSHARRGLAGAPRCGAPGRPAAPVHAPQGLGESPVSGLASPEFGVPLNPTTFIVKLDSVLSAPSVGKRSIAAL